MKAKPNVISKFLKLKLFSFVLSSIEKIDTGQTRQVLRAFIAVAAYAEMDPYKREFFSTLFNDKQKLAALINETSFCRRFLTLHFEAFLLYLTSQRHFFSISTYFSII